MILLLRPIILITISISQFACSTNVKLIDKSRTKYGDIKFYSENKSKKNSSVKRIYALVNTGDNKSYYSFYPDKIVKTTDTAKTLIYTVFDGQLQTNYDRNIYQRFSFLDSIVLTKGNNLLDSLGFQNFNTSEGAEAFQIEVNYYHGWPKHKKFRPSLQLTLGFAIGWLTEVQSPVVATNNSSGLNILKSPICSNTRSVAKIAIGKFPYR